MAIALYARKSIERENSISCETQIEYCKSVIKPDERSEKTIEFIDNGYSGGNVDRDGFQKMMRQIERGKISKVIVYRLDRISRSLSDFVGILETLKKHNVQFVSSQESFDTSSPYGEMIVKILLWYSPNLNAKALLNASNTHMLTEVKWDCIWAVAVRTVLI